MPFIEDLTLYQFTFTGDTVRYQQILDQYFFEVYQGRDCRAVGWLSTDKPFPTGETSQEFKEKLFEFCLDDYVVNLTRGFHECEFCTKQDIDERIRCDEKAHLAGRGNGEIRVMGISSVYAGPILIYHYVIEHQYNPPEEFVEAVLTGLSPNSTELREMRKKISETEWGKRLNEAVETWNTQPKKKLWQFWK